jgi:hypothetical protein
LENCASESDAAPLTGCQDLLFYSEIESFQARTKQKRQKAIIGELMKGIRPSIRSYVQPISLVLDILPLLSFIITPSFRPISLHLYNDEERKSLDHVVNVMVDYNLNYVQERTADGSYVYKLGGYFANFCHPRKILN